MNNLKQLQFFAVGALTTLMVLPEAALARSLAESSLEQRQSFQNSAMGQRPAERLISGIDRAKDGDDDDWDDDDDDDPIIRISGRVIRFGERDENEWIVEANGRRYRVDAGPRWWRNLPVSVGDQLTVEGELDDGELDAFWVQLANGETVQLRGRSGPPPWAGGRRRSR
ncbi:hypothetical protein H6F46_09675 [Limnothrix sp. FACHB-1083]|uniref:hypothetical protein n=1 Tax=unclassified Limnothrix TaxID=2632864 RepID=UPI001680609A|nr:MULTISPECIES: hypothetical protein [unclassified Limnothrix]MBD2160961.1 hypothetical protein [Limnothrix sp. FACHB-1083]MBD2191662.1 hypothetical protein [Limnothrix sp. FACHB-1088]